MVCIHREGLSVIQVSNMGGCKLVRDREMQDARLQWESKSASFFWRPAVQAILHVTHHGVVAVFWQVNTFTSTLPCCGSQLVT